MDVRVRHYAPHPQYDRVKGKILTIIAVDVDSEISRLTRELGGEFAKQEIVEQTNLREEMLANKYVFLTIISDEEDILKCCTPTLKVTQHKGYINICTNSWE